MKSSSQISCIIPAFNEEERISSVLKVLVSFPLVNEIVVVDDGSTDRTRNAAKIFGTKIKIIQFRKNQGKTRAVIAGVKAAKYKNILLFDVDLIGMKREYIENLIKKFNQGYDMVIMNKGGQPWAFRKLLKSVPALSGVRILRKSDFMKIGFRKKDRFQLEVRINDFFLKNGLKISVIPALTVYDPRKYRKYPFLKGLALDLKCVLEVITAKKGFLAGVRLLRDFRKISRYSGGIKMV